MSDTRMTLVFLDVAKEGCAAWVQYLCRKKGDKPDRPVEDRVGHISWSLPVPFMRRQALTMGKLLNATCESKRASRTYKNLIFSCEDTKEPAVHADNAEKGRRAALQFRELFAPHSDYVMVTHVEKEHAHTHLVLSNWDKNARRCLAWSNNQVLHMQSLDWCTVPGVVSGAYLYQERQAMSYPSGRKETQLVELLEKSSSEASDTIQAMVDAGGLEPYDYNGKPGVVFRSARVQLKSINFNLRKKRLKKAVALKDGKYVAVDHEEPFHGPVEQQQQVFDRMGVGGRLSIEDYERFLYDPLFDARDMTESQRGALHDLQAGREPRDQSIKVLLAKHINAHMYRAICYDGAERADDPQYVRMQYRRDRHKDMVRCPDGSLKSKDHVLWDMQPFFVWDISRAVARNNARYKGPHWDEFGSYGDWLDSMRRRPEQPNDQPL